MVTDFIYEMEACLPDCHIYKNMRSFEIGDSKASSNRGKF